MEATAAPRALSLLAASPPLNLRMNCWRFAVGGVRRRGPVAVRAKKKKRGRGGDGEAEERVDTHSFAPKAGEASGLFPEAVLLRKVRIFFSHPTSSVLIHRATRKEDGLFLSGFWF